jgi:Holliday junction resolvase RusA-like endonuclease
MTDTLFQSPPVTIPAPDAFAANLGGALLLSFWVAGEPAPGGSKKAIAMPDPRGSYLDLRSKRKVRLQIIDDAKRNAGWKRDVAKVGRIAMARAGLDLLDEPLGMACWFYTCRPKSHFGSRNGEPYIKDSAPQFNATNPDATKLMRSTEDALEGVVYVNDSRLVTSIPWKCYGNREGARVIVWRMKP